MPTPELFLAESRGYLTDTYLPAIRSAVEPLADEQVWWRPGEESNSIGNLVLHLSGNVRQWIVSGIGGEPDSRARQTEFDERGPVPKRELLDRLADTLAAADRALAALEAAPDVNAALAEVRRIQGRDTSVFSAVYHVVEHFSGHTGQIVWMSKALRAGGLG